MTGKKGIGKKKENEKYGTQVAIAGINPNHKKWLKEHPNFNFSAFVREALDKEMKKEKREKKRSEQLKGQIN